MKTCFIAQAGRDFKFISLSMSGCFSLGGLLLLVSLISLLSIYQFQYFLSLALIPIFFLWPACKQQRIWSAWLLVCTSSIPMGKTNLFIQRLSCFQLFIYFSLLLLSGINLQNIFSQGRFFFVLQRLLSPRGMLRSNDTTEFKLGRLKAA